jgi:Holliday junction resolvasome RuvABC endonuclease subunit
MDQIQRMVAILTGQRDFETTDASDAMALAITHAFFRRSPLVDQSREA